MSTSVNDKLFPRISRKIVQSARVNAPVVINVNYIVVDLGEIGKGKKERKWENESGEGGGRAAYREKANRVALIYAWLHFPRDLWRAVLHKWMRFDETPLTLAYFRLFLRRHEWDVRYSRRLLAVVTLFKMPTWDTYYSTCYSWR